MEIKRFDRGGLLFKEGDAADRVFRLRLGEVEIIREIGGQIIAMGTVAASQFIGEMAAIERRQQHSATARARTDAEVEILTVDEFLDEIERTPGVARNMIERLSQRLHIANERIIRDEVGKPSMAVEVPARGIRVAARSPWLRRQMPEPVAVDHLPFVVGRRPVTGEAPARQRQDLLLEDHTPFRLSRDHFMIVGHDGRCFVRDMSSTLGTVVNGEAIGEHFRKDESLLNDGENEVVAGGGGSRFVFAVTVA